MQKAFTKKADIARFKKGYSEGDIHTEVISNLIQPFHAKNHPELEKFNEFIYHKNVSSLPFLCNELAHAAFQEKFGRQDFIFEGNRKYKNYILEHEGLLFITPMKREVVMAESKPQDFLLKVLDFEKTFLQFVIDFALTHRAELEGFWQEKLSEMEETQVLVQGKINFDVKSMKNKPLKP